MGVGLVWRAVDAWESKGNDSLIRSGKDGFVAIARNDIQPAGSTGPTAVGHGWRP